MTQQTSSNPLEKLASPPIVEVICGIHFSPVRGLDPLTIGGYWWQRKTEFPEREIHPALEDIPPGLHLRPAVGPLRVWLVSADGALVVQVQRDRYYLNWRASGDDYPRFRRDGGLLQRCLAEFDRFSAYCTSAGLSEPTPKRVELGKVDSFVEGRHWNGPDDLADMIPMLEPVLSLHQTDKPNVALHFQEQRADHVLRVVMSTGLAGASQDETIPRAIRLETTVINSLGSGSDVREAFELANDQANAVFGNLVPPAEREKRFGEPGRQ